MGARRQTRSERDAFLARLEGRSIAERARLSAEHQAYVRGERDMDADFGLDAPTDEATPGSEPSTTTSAPVPATASVAPEPPRTTPAASPLHFPPPRRPPVGKTASYIAHAKKLRAKRMAAEAAAEKKAASKKKMTKRRVAELRRDEKQAKESRAIARATSAVAARAEAKKSERDRVAEEEIRGGQAREQALAQLQKKQPSAAEKRKRSPKPAAKTQKRSKTTSPHIADGGVNDPGPSADSDEYLSPGASPQRENAPTSSTCVARSLSMDADVAEINNTAVDSVRVVHNSDEDALYSDEEDSNNSEGWYTESVEGNTGEDTLIDEAGDGVEGDWSDDDPDSEYGANLLRLQKNRSQRELVKQRFAMAKARVSRDWKTTTTNWDTMTTEEMELLAMDEEALAKMRVDGWNFDPSTQPVRTEGYTGLFSGEYGPTEEVLELADSPLRLFFFFMPPSLWRRIATESNRYYDQQLNGRVDRMVAAQQARGEEVTREEVLLRETKSHKRILPEDVVHCIGLLVARMLCPHKRKFADHWAKTAVGAVPKGTFGPYVRKARFDRIMQSLHFTNNADPRAETDRAWKVRSVVDTLQQTFQRGYITPPVVSFDEAMIPSRSRHNVTRQFMKDKPHKWGTKLFMTCCADTAYCVRIEVYCGANQHSDELGGDPPTQYSADPNSGPSAVLRNLDKVLPPRQDGVFHAVVTDRFYTSVQLALQLLSRNVYLVGTIQTNKKGFPPALVVKAASRPPGVEHGSATIAVSKSCPQMQVIQWWDRLPVYLLSTGSSTVMETAGRHVPGGRRITIPCPSAMRDYHRWMGGVDLHDQLRLQRYSLQLSVRFRKYYKTIFLGLVDIAMVNAFIVYREALKRKGETSADHAEFLEVLQTQLLQTTGEDFEESFSPGPATPTRVSTVISGSHKLSEFPEWVQVREGVRKRPQHQCKVCSIRRTKVGQRSATRFYCEACSNGNKRVYLCDRVRPSHYVNNNMTCHQIWHIKWKNGDERPRPRVGRDIQMRGLGKKRRRRLKSGNDSDEEEDSEEDGATGSDVAGERGAQNAAGISEAKEAENVHETAQEGASLRGNDSE